MEKNDFVWADLSTYYLSEAKNFYSEVFLWEFYADECYHTAFQADYPCCALFEMPAFFQKIKMPSFWMSYIAVDDLASSVTLADQLGAKIELVDEKNPNGKIALIRDPLGAGFTICEGKNYPVSRKNNTHGAMMWNELHVSSIPAVRSFYSKLFEWKLIDKDAYSVQILDTYDRHIANIYEMDDTTRGGYEYWAVYFGVKDLDQSKSKVIQAGGTILSSEDNRVFVSDPFGAFFGLLQI